MDTRSTWRELCGPITPRRAILIAAFVGLAYVFRHLLVLLVFFVVFERPLEVCSDFVARRTGLRRGLALVLVLVVGGALVGLLAWLAFDRAASAFETARAALPERLAALRQTPLFALLQQHVQADTLLEAAKRQTETALSYLSTLGHWVLHALVGFVLALVFVGEEAELLAVTGRLSPRSLFGTLIRWLGYAADAVWVTFQFQVVVAACNAVLTWPILVYMGLAHTGALVFMIFVSGIVPVVGNFFSGLVLTLLAYQQSGIQGMIVFTILTFILHKVESYYLNPRLAARHVRLPGFVLIVSLLVWEQLVGFVGLFLSFPVLYLAQRIQAEFAEEDAPRETRVEPGSPAGASLPPAGGAGDEPRRGA
jgi:predicted PurR-regulated permease PerM